MVTQKSQNFLAGRFPMLFCNFRTIFIIIVREPNTFLRPDRKRGWLGYRGFFFSNFYKSVFSIVNIETWISKIRDFQTSVFLIFTCNKYRKDGCLKISDFLKSKFSIFTIYEYRKHGFMKVGEKNPRYPRNPCFRPGPFLKICCTPL